MKQQIIRIQLSLIAILLLTSSSLFAQLTVNSTITNISCNGGTDGEITATASGGAVPYTYLWSDPSAQTTASATGLVAGCYEVTVTDDVGVTATHTACVTEPTLIFGTITPSAMAICDGDPMTFTSSISGGTGGYTYQWYFNAAIIPGATNANYTAISPGDYYLQVTDLNGCIYNSTTIPIQSGTAPNVSITPTTQTVCTGNDATFTASATPAFCTFDWANGTTGNVMTTSIAGKHYLTVTDSAGCTALDSVQLNNFPAVSSSVSSLIDVACFGDCTGEATVVASGGTPPYHYQWANGQITATATSLCAGNFSVTVMDANACMDFNNALINQPPTAISTTATVTSNYNGEDVSCAGSADGQATAVASGGTAPYTYLWDNASTAAVNNNLSTGTYAVTATDANGCTDIATVVVTEPLVFTATISSFVDESCGCDGSATVAGFGGTGAYSFAWSNGETAATATGLCTGSYSVTVADANGCTDVETVFISPAPALVTVALNSSTDVSCNGGADGELNFTAFDGVAPYTFDIGGGPQANGTFSSLGTGNYTVTATDNNGCTDTMTVSLIEPSPLSLSISGTNPTCVGGGDGDATVTVTGGVPTYFYAWSVGVTTATISDQSPGVSAGMYEVTVTDGNGCVEVDTVYLSDPQIVQDLDTILYVSPDSTLDFCVPYSATALNAAVVSTLVNGNIVDNGGGCFTYTPTNIAENIDTIIVQVCDTGATFEHQIIAYTASCVWAGDTDTNQVANNFDLLPIGTNYGLIADPRPDADLNWDCEPMHDWSLVPTGNPDPKHSDTNGDGIINDDDTLAITLNWGQVYVKNGSPTSANGIPIYVDTTSAAPGQTIQIPVVLGTNLLPANNAYGVAFTLTYDNSVVDTNSVSMDYSNSWLGTDGLDMITIEKDFYAQGEIQVGMTRIDQLAVSGSGAIAHIQLTIKDDVLKSALLRMDFEVKDVKLIDQNGTVMPVAPEASSSVVIASAVRQQQNKIGFDIYPNPTNALINLKLPAANQQMLKLYNVQGQLLKAWQLDAKDQMQLDLQDYPAGAYLLQLVTEDGVETKRLVKIR
jgi:hypothetical protein